MSISFSFPSAPVQWQIFADPNGKKWRYTGYCWVPVDRRFAVNLLNATSYIFQRTDPNSLVASLSASATTFEIPYSTTTQMPLDIGISLEQLGAGQLTITAANGVTLQPTPGYQSVLAGQYAGAYLVQQSLNYWALSGNLMAG